MIGAIIGDIVGSVYEFDNLKSKDFELFKPQCEFTDDTVLTVAVAEALMKCKPYAENEFKEILIDTMHRYGDLYPDVGYGGRYLRWVNNHERKPYNSCGNGSAMRVSAVGWYAKTLAEAENVAKASAEVTHNHPDGIAGAQSVAGVIFLAKNGADKEQLKAYMEKYYSVDYSLDDIRPVYQYEILNRVTVPQAFLCFYEATDFEDTVRNAVSLGGDSDTLAAIAGSMAEAFYGMEKDIAETAMSYLDDNMREIINSFYNEFIY